MVKLVVLLKTNELPIIAEIMNFIRRNLIVLFLFTTIFTFGQNNKEYFIKVKPGSISVNELHNFINDKIKSTYEIKVSAPFILKNEILQNTFLVILENDLNLETNINLIKDFSFVEYIEEVPEYEFFYTPNDLQPQQYNLTNIQADLAWDFTLGDPNVVIAIVDDAVLLSHQDLAGKIWTNPGEIPGNNIDDDGNGYVDDVNGWDAADNDNNPNPFNPTNSSFTHGTHVAGISGAETDNTIGIASIGFNCTLMPIKIANDATIGLTGAYQGVQYAIVNNANVINMSWGGGGYSATYQAIFDQAYLQGITCIAAAGNSNTNVPMYPASYNHVISVAATDISDTKASFSNYGTTIDVSAPGVNIYSTLAGANNSYGNMSGTSMASPLVAGLAGLMLSYSPGLSPDDLEACLKSTCDDISSQNPSYNGMLGAGRINAYQAMQCLKPITANFSSSMQFICAGNTIQYFDESNNNPISWNWSFPGGSPSSSTLQNPIVTYPTNGFYDATLIVVNADGTDTLTITNYITVGVPTASISGSFTTLPGYPVQIPVYFTGTPPWSFSYTDGTNTYNVNNVYSNPYNLIVTDTVSTTYNLVSVSDTNCAGTVSGQFDVIIITTGCLNLINNGDFQNGNTGFTTGFPYACSCTVGSVCVGSEPRDKCANSLWINDLWDHTFGNATGKYLLIDGATNTNVWTQNVPVVSGTTYNFSYWVIRKISDPGTNAPSQILNVVINGVVVQTVNTAPFPPTDWVNFSVTWTSNITGIIPFKIDQVSGVSWNDWGLDDIELFDCVASQPCNSTAEFTSDIACVSDTTFFTDLSTDSLNNIVNWYWDFGDGDSIIGVQNPNHIYNSTGSFTVQLIVFNDNFCTDTISHIINVYNNLALEMNQIDTICIGDSIPLLVNNYGCGAQPYSYQWNPTTGLNYSNIINPIAGPTTSTTYILTITDALGNAVSDTVFIYVDTTCCKYQANIQGNQFYCLSDSIQLINNSNFDSNAQYEWDFGIGATPTSYIGFTPPSITYNSDGIHSVSLIISGLCESDTAYFSISIFPQPILPLLNDTTICGLDTIQVGETAISTYSYLWSPAGGFNNPTISDPLAFINPPMVLYLEVTDSQTGCIARDSMIINGGFPYESFDTTQICQGDSIYLAGSYQYVGGDFMDNFISSFGCDSIIHTHLVVLSQSAVNILTSDTIISTCNNLQLHVVGADSYSWYPQTGLSCYNCSDPLVTLSQDINYLVIGNENYCESSDTIMIQIIPSDPLFIPNVFSPNNDGSNEIYNAVGDCIESFHLRIYNRWGKLLFESFDRDYGWNGKTTDGKDASEGTYYYIFEITNIESGIEQLEYFSGSLTLVR